jgi:hypothetical protein
VESAPVIPPGEVAPPFVPGGTPPVIGAPGTPTVPEPGPARAALLAYHLTAFHATAADAVTVGGEPVLFDLYDDVVPAAEVTPRWRTTMNFSETPGVRLQAHVVSAGDVRLIGLGSLDGGATWGYLNADYEGPYLTCTTTGERVGPFVNIDPLYASGDVLVSIFATAPDSGTVTLGNVHAMSVLRMDDGEPPVYVIVTDCAVNAGLESEGDFSQYADFAAFVSARNGDDLFTEWEGPTTAEAQAFFDEAKSFNGSAAMTGVYTDVYASTSGIFPHPTWRTRFPSSIQGGGNVTVVWQMVMELESGWNLSETDAFNGLCICTFFPRSGIYAGDSAGLWVRGSRLYVDYVTDFLTPAANSTDVGAADDLSGGPKQVTCRFTKAGSSVQFEVWIDNTCEPPTNKLYDETWTALRPTWPDLAVPGDVTLLDASALEGVFADGTDGDGKKVWLWQVSYDTDASTYGL